MNALRPRVGVQQASKGQAKVLAVVVSQALDPHLPVVYSQTRQQGDGAMSMVIEFLTLDLAGAHRLLGAALFHHLQIGFLTHSEDPLPPPPQALNSLVIPED